MQPTPAVHARLRVGAATLGPSEARVAAALLANADAVAEWSTQELAAAAGTSPATVIRACQNLGFRGFQHLRLELARTGGERAPAEAVGDPIARAFAEARDALALAGERADRAAVAAAVDRLAVSGRILFVGSGFSAPPLQDAALRFATIGRPVEAPADVLAQQFAAHSLGPGDTCLALSYSGANAHTLAAARAAAGRGAAVVAICGYARSPLARLAGVTLVGGAAPAAHGVDPFLSRLGQLVLLHALHGLLAERLGCPDPAGMRAVVAEALAEPAEVPGLPG